MSGSTYDPWTATVCGKPAIGAKACRSRRTTANDIVLFTEISGDQNPLHYDKALADASVFGRLIVQGGVTSGILNALVAEDLPGPGTVFLEVSWRFLKAVGIDELITGEAEVLSVRDDKPICRLRTRVVDEAGDECLAGEATVYVAGLRQPANAGAGVTE
jgi:acyl dehydratase